MAYEQRIILLDRRRFKLWFYNMSAAHLHTFGMFGIFIFKTYHHRNSIFISFTILMQTRLMPSLKEHGLKEIAKPVSIGKNGRHNWLISMIREKLKRGKLTRYQKRKSCDEYWNCGIIYVNPRATLFTVGVTNFGCLRNQKFPSPKNAKNGLTLPTLHLSSGPSILRAKGAAIHIFYL